MSNLNRNGNKRKKSLRAAERREIFARNVVPGISRIIPPAGRVRICQEISKSVGRNLLAGFSRGTTFAGERRAIRRGIERIFDLRLHAHSRLGRFFSFRTSARRPCMSVTSETTRFRSLRLVGATGFRAEHVTTGSAR